MSPISPGNSALILAPAPTPEDEERQARLRRDRQALRQVRDWLDAVPAEHVGQRIVQQVRDQWSYGFI